jgi:hypothetical protein
MSNGQYRNTPPSPSGSTTGSTSGTNMGTVTIYTISAGQDAESCNPTIEDAGIRAGEITAYRAWRVHSDGLLHSMYVDHYAWTPKGIERVNHLDSYGGDGIHAYKTMEQCEAEYGPYGLTVYGEVALWGEVIEHDHGYRAQYARITEIIKVYKISKVLPWNWGWKYTKTALRRKYGV